MSKELSKWDPYREFQDLQSRLASMFSRQGGEEGALTSPLKDADWVPACDITEDESEFLITADLPEVKKEEVNVEVHDGMLTITGERRREEEKKDKKYHRIERTYGKYVRSFRLPEEVDPDKVEARFDNGVLNVHLPKSAGNAPPKREVAVK